ncbi:cystatin-like [Oncorhynchus mykiss]|uniref:Cystatin domain-containing protein n=1 Tax=Oncorhynchus mykiss TaxID=8022 RepID=A0A8C7QJZ0_ONCMY|nr:cystatin-like [Oncorhynchus mykiss]
MLMDWKIVVPLLAVAFIVVSADGIPGGVVDADMKDQATRDALQFAVAEYNKETYRVCWQVAKVVKAQKQVVAGMKYIFTVQMARTLCRKGGVEKYLTVHQDQAVTNQCTFEVWSRPWLGAIQLIKNDCQPLRPKGETTSSRLLHN